MRLLRCDTEELTLQTFNDDSQVPRYAILSHTWLAEQEEVTFFDLHDHEKAKLKLGWSKLDHSRRRAREDGYLFVWIDTCCIDKGSSAELAEAINSMFRWYKNAKICYVYPANFCGVVSVVSNLSEELILKDNFISALQELLAPVRLHFYDMDWKCIGVVHRHNTQYCRQSDCRECSHAEDIDGFVGKISEITGIGRAALLGLSRLDRYSIAQRMCWANRKTTRAEDRAYSLLGIFDINMPVIYGEGHKAFQRLQHEILRAHSDQSLFAWHAMQHSDVNLSFQDTRILLAPSHLYFRNSNEIVPLAYKRSRSYEPISVGIRMTLPVMRQEGNLRGILHCALEDDRTKAIALNISLKDDEQEAFLIRDYQRI
ncbi:Vegetative incompatibility protein HET-E-1 [Fulvia fulva]|uniref:Vegetative incompatibility protein HET-E-1 n=1 Tax=Passalora fulva TaxID=5499 RepID=A0A9Q8PDM7_PASFU|nr:Vegetative incompatibility protein HET-E-1 [Fulvia fulva]KAK4620131.1 Vegetative incompatibility protein HET-E-1 [Fulvia fulva]KAK4620501.1 Vegetative incompatibility protein HET-E-1 [Fulvia fulva]UJO20482.1 Vegetative incompatibility protein HET-E-1 [Fulvia fulva]WPV17067.1 Vegetative incompatibility protein HET-E-1 [Fulvia fulva]WPV32229.1 Vegetative incompatibility protein HET-E-1 [Fulvia fulva]